MSNQQKQKVICLGLGRTGTSSLREALDKLGFGPCYHMLTIRAQNRVEDFALWGKVSEGKATSEEIRDLIDDFGSVLDYPAAIYGAQLYAAYPDAKFILTVRDPEKWERSMRSTILKFLAVLRKYPNKPPIFQATSEWGEHSLGKYHNGRIETHTQEEFHAHTARIKRIIPSAQLLVYDVSEGWDKLVEFLDVPKPAEPFPHSNDTIEFQQDIERFEIQAKRDNPM